MRVWLRPDRMAQLGISVQDVSNAIQSQNQTFGIGQIGAEPTPQGVQQTFVVTAQGLLTQPEEFEDIIVRTAKEGTAIVRVRDIGRVELAKRDYSMTSEMNGRTATTIGIFQQPGANAVETAAAVRARLEELKKQFLDRTRLQDQPRHQPVHAELDRQGRAHLLRGGDPGSAGGVRLPAVVAGYHRPDPRGAGVDRRHLHRHAPARFFDQHVDDVRPDPRDRPGGRRRDRGGRKRRDQHGEARPRCAGSRQAGDERDRRCADLHRAGAGGGVHAGRLSRWRHRHALPAVCDHHRDLCGDLGNHGTHAVARAGGHHHQGAPRREKRLLPLVRAGLRAAYARLCRRRRAPDPGLDGRAHPVCRDDRRHRAHVPRAAGQLRAGRGPGVFLRGGGSSRHGKPGLCRCPRRSGIEDHRQRAGGAGRGAGKRLQPGRRHLPQQCGGAVRFDEAVRRTHGCVAAHL